MDETWKDQCKTEWNIKRIIHSNYIDAQSYRTGYIICSKLTLKTPDANLVSCQLWRWFTCYSNVYIANFEQVTLCQKPMFQHYTEAERHNRFTTCIADFKHIPHLVLVFLLLTFSIYSIAEFYLSYSSHL